MSRHLVEPYVHQLLCLVLWEHSIVCIDQSYLENIRCRGVKASSYSLYIALAKTLMDQFVTGKSRSQSHIPLESEIMVKK